VAAGACISCLWRSVGVVRHAHLAAAQSYAGGKRSAGGRYSFGEIESWVGTRLSDFAFGIAGGWCWFRDIGSWFGRRHSDSGFVSGGQISEARVLWVRRQK
jgi:hypothetical protein